MKALPIIVIVIVIIIIIALIGAGFWYYKKKKSTGTGNSTGTGTGTTGGTGTSNSTGNNTLTGPDPIGKNVPITGPVRVFHALISDGAGLVVRGVKLVWNTKDKVPYTRGVYSISGRTSKDEDRLKQYGCFVSPPTSSNNGSLILKLLQPTYDSTFMRVNGPPDCDYNAPVWATLVMSTPKNSETTYKVVDIPKGSTAKLVVGETFKLPLLSQTNDVS